MEKETLLDRQRFTRIANEALGQAAVTALELDSYFVEFVEFEFEGRTFEFLPELFEGDEEMFRVDRFSRIFNDLGIQVSMKPLVQLSFSLEFVDIYADVQGVRYTLKRVNIDSTFGFVFSFETDEFRVTFTKGVFSVEKKGTRQCETMDITPEANLNDYNLYVRGTTNLKFENPNSTLRLAFTTNQNLTAREEAIEVARKSWVYRIYKLIHG